MYSKLSKRLKSGEANALGLVEDAQGTLQREMMSYSAITGRLYVCVWGQEAKKKTEGEKAKCIPQPQVEGCGP